MTTKIKKKCKVCKSTFHVYWKRKDKAKYCSIACANIGQSTREKRKLKCKLCGDEFIVSQDHGKWPKFCCREHFDRRYEITHNGQSSPKPEPRTCPSCDAVFIAKRSGHGLHIYCSNKCRKNKPKIGKEKPCLNCGKMFYLTPATQRQRNEESCCSAECQSQYYRGTVNKNWQGKYKDNTVGDIRVNLPRPGYKSNYIAEHRVVASQAIGRLLLRHEVILHLNMNKEDNRPENLFICSSGECTNYIHARLPWPKKSNLNCYS